MNAWLKRSFFNPVPDVIRKAIPEFGSQMQKSSTYFGRLCYPCTTKSPEFCDLRKCDGL